MKRMALAVVLLVSLAAPAWADFQDGVAAIERGDYATAFQEFKALADDGAAEDQTNLGLMYKNGHGVTQDYVEAAM